MLNRYTIARSHRDGLLSLLGYMLCPSTPHRFRWGRYRFLIRTQDWFASREIVMGGEYSIIETLLPRTGNPIVLDMGANIGLFSLAVFRQNQGSRVIALEPAPDTFALLEKTRKLNPSLDWHIHQLALFASSGWVEFSTEGFSTGRRISAGQTGKTTRVSSVTLDDLARTESLPPTIDLLKLDIEGAEEAVLESSTDFLRRVKCVVIELHDNVNHGHCLELLRGVFPWIYRVTGRQSSKPVLVCSCEVLQVAGLAPV